MSCTQYGFTIQGDVNNKLAKSVDIVAGYDSTKRDILAGYFGTEDFTRYVEQETGLKNYVDVNANTMRRLLGSFFVSRHNAIVNGINKKNADALNGFSSATAKSIAKDHTSNIIIDTYDKEISKPKTERFSKINIIREVSKIINTNFNIKVAVPLIKQLKVENTNKEALAIIEKVSNINDEIKRLNKQRVDTIKQFNNTEDTDVKAILNPIIDATALLLNQADSQRYVLFGNLVDKFGNVREKNYATLNSQVRGNPNKWYSDVFKLAKLIDLANDFNNIVEDVQLNETNYADENDISNTNNDSVDNSSKSWEDTLHTSFDKYVSSDLKLYLNKLYKLASPTPIGNIDYHFDDNNELGVPTTMGSNFIQAQISNYGTFNSVNDFIDKITIVSQTNPSLYGLSKMINDMNFDRVWANKIFTQLNNPRISKSTVVVSEDSIKFDHSNKSADPSSHMIYSLINSLKGTYRTNFNVNDRITIQNAITSINNVKNSIIFTQGRSIEGSTIKTLNNTINAILLKYFPKIDLVGVTKYLYSNEDAKNTYIKFFENLSVLVNNIEDVVDDHNKQESIYNEEYGKWAKKKRIANDAELDFNTPKPIFDKSIINFSKLDAPIIDLTKKLINYTAIKNELNSVNAEGNLASDLIGNSYITNFLKQIQYGNAKESEAGLRHFRDFIVKSPQYYYSPFYFGVKDDKGNVKQPGLFNRDSTGKVTINPNAKNFINISLFDGIKDRDNSKSTMYSGMSKGDYFITQLLAFKAPVKDITKSTNGVEIAGYFMRTPSDASKNFILQAPKYNTDSLWRVINESRTKYSNEIQQELEAKYDFTNEGKYIAISEGVISTNSSKVSNNYMTAKQIYDMLNNPIENKVFTNLYNKYDKSTNKVIIPIIYKKDESRLIVYLEGDVTSVNGKSIAENIEIKEIYNSGNMENGVLPYDFLIDIEDTITNNGIDSGRIERIIDKNNVAFRALHGHVLGEINNFVHNLNNVFEKKAGKWTSKTSLDNLTERAHYKDGVIVKDGKLTGNFFNFIKLFQTQGLNAGEDLKSGLFLYGQGVEGGLDPLLSVAKNGKLNLNTNRTDLVNIKNGKIELNISNENTELINNVVEEWLNNYHKEVLSRTTQYNTILDNKYSNNDIVDYAINNAIMEMNFDDLFEGDTKFYKSAQDLLKRSKQLQAGGVSYANFDFNDSIGGAVYDILDKEGNTIPIVLTGVSNFKVNARNGFKAVTITNTVKSSSIAPNIKVELIDILTPELGKTEATRMATDIAAGYFNPTITNDGVSIITIDEFIARRHADGTLNDYQDLLTQLLDNSVLPQDMNLKGINARIQVQKNFYFDKQFDPSTGVYYPRQIKNAEFVLIPKLIKGTDLEKLYNVMKVNSIDQINTVEASKAAKKNILTFWDNNGVANVEEFDKSIKANKSIAIEDYYYQYLYKQQDVADHIVNETNKAGIQVMKKLIDNASPEVQNDINNFFDNYVANIKDSFNTLLFNMGWKLEGNKLVDASGKTNADGNNVLQFKDFYKRARVEAQRLGMDSNFMEYLTEDASGQIVMPNYMNNISSKLESVAQSIFNNSVTRQTLPGWHAPQISSVGHGVPVLGEDGVFRTLKYHPQVTDKDGKVTQEVYAEIMLPRWSTLIPKDYDLSKLATEGLDIHLAYRIPTEGKQSVSILKVVGFLDEVYGSTVMVPDEWVTQTGSDFDVDSVYGISYEIYKAKDGTVKKIEFDESLVERDVQRRYINHVNANIEERVEKDVITDDFKVSKINELRDTLKDINQRQSDSEYFRKLMREKGELYNKLTPEYQNRVKRIDNTFVNNDVVERYNNISNVFGLLADNETGDFKDQLQEFADYHDAIAYTIGLSKQNEVTDEHEFKSAKRELIKGLYEDNRLEYLNKVQNVAKEAGIVSYNEFANWSIEEQNSRRARNNRILDSMINIMKSPTSREENYSRSNFEDLTTSMKKMDNLRGASSISRSTYNPLDQIDFMENAMTGAMLKSLSVTRDTFNSVNNYTKSELGEGHEIVVEYDLSETIIDPITKKPILVYNINNIKKAYDKVEEDKSQKVVRVTHNRIANSNNNRNVIGKLLTVYSSQTTAHILDAVKEGTIFNENDYTFGTFKTLLDVGIDYDTAIAFLMQPGVTKIVDAYFETKSIYINNSSRPVDTAIKSIAIDLGITVGGRTVNEYTPIKSVIQGLSSNRNLQMAYRELFAANVTYVKGIDLLTPALNGKMLQNRLKSVEITNNPELRVDTKLYRDAAFDLAMIFNFDKYRNTSNNIAALARVSNPDRFGAKQTIRSTRVTLNNIIKYVSDPNDKVGLTILVNGRSLIDSLYPGVDSTQGIDVKSSSYPYLAAFLKYATQPSVEANSQLFPTESTAFNAITDTVQARLNINFTDEQYKEYKQYMISNVYAAVPFLTTPLTLNNYGLITPNNKIIEEQTESNNLYWDEERGRIFGYDVTESSSLEINDINNPTEEDVNKFNHLTPAQKVIWIQTNFEEDRGIFAFLDVNMFHQQEVKQRGFSSQSIKYSDQIDDIEEIYVAFRSSFFHKNALVRLAAIDLIKYSFIAEGGKFKKGSISKIITNDTLYSNLEDKGINLIDAIEQQFVKYTSHSEGTTKKFIDKFVRSHSEIVKVISISKPKKDKQGNKDIGSTFNKQLQGEGIVYIPFEEATKELLEHITIVEDNPKDYIRIKKYVNDKQKITLYKTISNNKGVYLYPLNILERNETSEYSVNKRNNVYKASEYYEAIVKMSEDNGAPINELLKDNITLNQINILKAQFTITPHNAKSIIETIENNNEIIRISKFGKPVEIAEVNKFVTDILNHINLPVEEQGNYAVVRNDNLFINSLIPNNSFIVQNIPNGDDITTVKISRHTTKNGLSKQFSLVLKENPKADRTKIKFEELKALQNSIDGKSINPILYKIERVTSEQERENYEELKKQVEDEAASQMNAVTNLIEDFDADVVFNFTDNDKVARDIFNELNKRALSNDDKRATKFKKGMDIAGVDRTSDNSIHDNQRNIYTSAASYYKSKSIEHLTNINTFNAINGETYSIDDPSLYKHLTEYPEDYPLLVKLILEAKTFGEQFYDIFNLSLTGEDASTNKAIEVIRDSITEVRTNSKLKNAVNLLFNDYIANNFSTNPIIRHGLIELKTTFGDTDWFDMQFSDIGELNHKQVQAVTKHVYSILNEATKVIAPKSIATFNKQHDAILARPGEYNQSNIITKEGKFINPYSEKFLEDREKVVLDLKVAKENYKNDPLGFYKTKLARDKWRAKNVQQEVSSSYYHENNALVGNVINSAPQEYIKYKDLTDELYNKENIISGSNKEERDRRRELNAKIRNITSEIKEDGELKSDEQRFRAIRLRNYIEAKRSLDREYFNYDETDGFKDTLEYYTTIIKQYEKKHPIDTLDQKLNNEHYREAYEWIQGNTIYSLNEEAQKTISAAFAALKVKDNPNSTELKKLLKDSDAYDDFGNLDARKLTAEQISKIKELTQHKYSWTYDSNAGEAILIKDIPAGLPVLSDKFYRMLRAGSENDSGVNVERLRVIGEINKLLSKTIDVNTGQVNSKDLFDKLTEEELDNLGGYYRTLHNIKGNRDNKELAKRFKANVDFLTHDVRFNTEWAYAQNNLKNSKQYDTWLNIFIQTDKQGNYVTKDDGSFVPNNDIFGYILPKDKTYIDDVKTKARNTIENDIEYVTNEYYHSALKEATKQGKFNEWYNANHSFNPYTHRMEPLKVWTTMQVNPNGNLKGTYSYAPTYDNTERTVKDEYVNANNKQYSTNYNIETGEYNNLINLSPKEKDMLDLFQSTINSHASTHSMRMFAEQGYLPRRATYKPDAKWYVSQVLGSVGLEFRNTGEQQWTDKVDYVNDFDTDFNMMSLIKQKGYKEHIKIPSIGTRQSPEDYAKDVEDIRKENKSIDAANLKLDNELLDNDWRSVFNDFIGKATEYNAKKRSKNTIYLLLEDLKETPAFKESAWGRNLKKDGKKSSIEQDRFQTVSQTRTQDIVQNWTRRILFDQFKKGSPYSKYADLAQNITSAKYMIANVMGGVSNIATGMANVLGEVAAQDYFDKDTFAKGQARYFSNSLSMLSDMYSDTTNNLSVGIVKFFNIVDFEAFTESRPNEKATETVKRVRNSLYSMQSGGEHYMQNSVLFAILKSHRVFKDTDGQMRVGSISNYNWELEVQTLMGMLNGKEDLLIRYKSFLKDIKTDLNELRKYDSFTKDFNEEFLRDVGDKQLIQQYITKRKEALSTSKEEFNKNPLAEDQFELVDGYVKKKDNSPMSNIMLGEFVQKVVTINKKIHGVYDKIGAASIEKEWWGGLAMQYHKHIYPGIMKRYRMKGYYNELRSSVEKGSYVSLADYLSVEFKGLGKRVNARVESDNENIALASFQEVIKASIDTVLNLKMNYQLMPIWEQNNMRRALGDLLGITSAFMVAISIHLMTDDDEIKESELLSTALYMADRLNSESSMYTPMGLFAEAGTLWSSPIAAQNGPKDLIKGLGIATGMLFDAEYNPNYTTGLYKGENKMAVLLYRNTPIYRVYQRLSTMTKNNNYYKINENALNIKFAKAIANKVNPD